MALEKCSLYFVLTPPTNAGLTSLDNGEWGIKDDGNNDDGDNDGGKDNGENGGGKDDGENGGSKDDSENGGNEGIEYSDGDENYYKGQDLSKGGSNMSLWMKIGLAWFTRFGTRNVEKSAFRPILSLFFLVSCGRQSPITCKKALSEMIMECLLILLPLVALRSLCFTTAGSVSSPQRSLLFFSYLS